jgi:hypothetical protein
MNEPSYIIDGLKFYQTCIACPEQYDVFDQSDKQVGYLRLRGGWFRVDYPECLMETIYEHHFPDTFKGCFDEDERNTFLKIAAQKIKERLS